MGDSKKQECEGQMNIFDFLPKAIKTRVPGDWIEEDELGRELTFDEIEKRIGDIVVLDESTVSHKWYKVVQIERIIKYGPTEDDKQLVFYDGVKQRGYIRKRYFAKDSDYYRTIMYELKGK